MRGQHVIDIDGKFLEPGFNYFVQNGLENATLRNLCKETNISTSSLYYWFDNKEELYVNIAEYGYKKVVKELYSTLFSKKYEAEEFFDEYLTKVQKFKPELRLILQMASSPMYGKKMRDKIEEYKPLFMSCAEELSKKYNCDTEEALSIIYSLRSITNNYVIFENYEDAKKEMDLLYSRLSA